MWCPLPPNTPPAGFRGSLKLAFAFVLATTTRPGQLCRRRQQPEEAGAPHSNRRLKGAGETRGRAEGRSAASGRRLHSPELCSGFLHQVKIFEEDFRKERSDRERMNEEKEDLRRQVERLQGQITNLTNQVTCCQVHCRCRAIGEFSRVHMI